MFNNTRFSDSELIKQEVDDMDECLDHFEAAQSVFPICGRTLSDNELSEVLKILRNDTCFSIEKDIFDENEVEKVFVIRVPLSREDLISAEVEQELFFAWGQPEYMTCDINGTDRWTEYHYNISGLKRKNLNVNRIDSLKKQFFDLFFKKAENDSLEIPSQ